MAMLPSDYGIFASFAGIVILAIFYYVASAHSGGGDVAACPAGEEETFDGRMHVLYTEPRANVPFCLSGVPDDFLPVLARVWHVGFRPATGPASECAWRRDVVRIANAIELRALGADSVVLGALEQRRAFLMIGAAGPLTSRGVTPAAALFVSPGSVRFVCGSRGAEFALRLIASSYGVASSSLRVQYGSTRTLPGPDAVLCSMTTLPALSSPSSPTPLTVFAYDNEVLRGLVEVDAPFARFSGIYAKDVYPLFPGKQAIFELLCAEDLLTCPRRLEGEPPVALLAKACIDASDQQGLARNTFYAGFFPYAKDGADAIRRRSVAIAEGFSGGVAPPSTPRIEVLRPIRGRMRMAYGGRVKLFTIESGDIGGVPVRVGDRVVLKGQVRIVENGEYHVKERRPSRATLVSPAVVEPSGKLFTLGENGCKGFALMTAQSVLRDGDPVYVPSQGRFGRVVREGSAVEMTCRSADDEDRDRNKYHAKARCVADPAVPVKELCESPVDAWGAPKKPGVWDRPCETDADCPFFNTGAPADATNRGGCMNSGYCEMPLGVRQVSYTTFAGEPICHGCPRNDGKKCCAASTGVAFAQDRFDRGEQRRI